MLFAWFGWNKPVGSGEVFLECLLCIYGVTLLLNKLKFPLSKDVVCQFGWNFDWNLYSSSGEDVKVNRQTTVGQSDGQQVFKNIPLT